MSATPNAHAGRSSSRRVKTANTVVTMLLPRNQMWTESASGRRVRCPIGEPHPLEDVVADVTAGRAGLGPRFLDHDPGLQDRRYRVDERVDREHDRRSDEAEQHTAERRARGPDNRVARPSRAFAITSDSRGTRRAAVAAPRTARAVSALPGPAGSTPATRTRARRAAARRVSRRGRKRFRRS